jgi:hypothetical protein
MEKAQEKSEAEEEPTENIPSQEESKNTEDGRFFMTFENFTEEFNQVSFCYYRDEFKLSATKQDLDSKYIHCFKFNIIGEGEYYIGLSQPD